MAVVRHSAADRLILVAGTGPPTAPDERLLGSDLVFVESVDARGGASWLDQLPPRAHHFVDPERHAADTGRAARRMTGRSLGVVLSGGGARGFAHIGALEVLHAERFELDRIGGCSMGAFIGGMAATGWAPRGCGTPATMSLSGVRRSATTGSRASRSFAHAAR